MGIDAQRSGARELPDRAVEVRRAQGATTKAIPVWIVEEEQRSDRPHSGPCNLRQTDDGRAQQDPCALRVAAARGHLRCWRPSTMHTDIACGPPPSMRHLVKPLLVLLPYRLGFRSPGFPLSGPPLRPGDGVKASRSEPAGLGLDAALPGR